MKIRQNESNPCTLTRPFCHTAYMTGYRQQRMRRTDTWSRFHGDKPPNNFQQSARQFPLCVYDQSDNIQCNASRCLIRLQYVENWCCFFGNILRQGITRRLNDVYTKFNNFNEYDLCKRATFLRFFKLYLFLFWICAQAGFIVSKVTPVLALFHVIFCTLK